MADEKKYVMSADGQGIKRNLAFIDTGSSEMPEECCSCLKPRNEVKALVSLGHPSKPLPYYVCNECIRLMHDLVGHHGG